MLFITSQDNSEISNVAIASVTVYMSYFTRETTQFVNWVVSQMGEICCYCWARPFTNVSPLVIFSSLLLCNLCNIKIITNIFVIVLFAKLHTSSHPQECINCCSEKNDHHAAEC